MERSDTYLRGNAGPPDVAAPEAGTHSMKLPSHR